MFKPSVVWQFQQVPGLDSVMAVEYTLVSLAMNCKQLKTTVKTKVMEHRHWLLNAHVINKSQQVWTS